MGLVEQHAQHMGGAMWLGSWILMGMEVYVGDEAEKLSQGHIMEMFEATGKNMSFPC